MHQVQCPWLPLLPKLPHSNPLLLWKTQPLPIIKPEEPKIRSASLQLESVRRQAGGLRYFKSDFLDALSEIEGRDYIRFLRAVTSVRRLRSIGPQHFHHVFRGVNRDVVFRKIRGVACDDGLGLDSFGSLKQHRIFKIPRLDLQGCV